MFRGGTFMVAFGNMQHAMSTSEPAAIGSPIPFPCWLVVWNRTFLFFQILGMSSSQLTNSNLFQRGRFNHQPDVVTGYIHEYPSILHYEPLLDIIMKQYSDIYVYIHMYYIYIYTYHNPLQSPGVLKTGWMMTGDTSRAPGLDGTPWIFDRGFEIVRSG